MPAIHLLISALCECGLFVFLFFLTFPICIFASSFFMRSYLLFYFLFYLLPSRILDPLRFQAGGRRRRPNLGLGLVCFVLMFAVFLVKDACVWYVVINLVLVL